MAGETKLVLSKSGYTSVTIWVTKIDHNFDKNLVAIDIPSTASSQDSQTKPKTWIVDLARVKEMISVQGYLIDETTEAAITKKWNLIKLFRYGRGKVIISWGSGNNQQKDKDKNVDLIGSIIKLAVTETGGIVGLQQSGYFSEKNFAVQFAMVLGDDRLG